LYSSLVYPFPERPAAGGMLEVAPGVHWIRMPIPIPGLEFINLWAIEDGDGWTIVDSGLRSKRIQAHWEEIFAGPMAGRPVARLICTHFHPDHLGQAGWITRRFGAPLWMTLAEWSFGRMLSLEEKESVPDEVLDFYRRIGFGPEPLEQYRQRGYNNYRRAVTEIPSSFRRIAHDDVLSIGGREWRVIVGYGHSQEHACLYCAELGVLISGDQILPRITPHIGVYPGEPEANPLKFYLDSLPTFRPLPADTLVLPSHNDPFRGLHLRLDQMAEHHDIRLAALEAACVEPRTALEILPVLFRRQLDERSTFMAVGEALAHLHWLIARGRMARELGSDGVMRFRQQERRADAA
jgi:glyoxylase-like metal-dependent hydrolase (beta-lactamase superfamily II)